MTFTEFLVKRRIDEAAFAHGDAGRYAQWQTLYAQMHPNSFYNSVKMVLNDVRRRFHLVQVPVAVAETAVLSSKPKPVIRRAPSAQPTENATEQATVSRQPAEIIAQQSAPVTEEKKIEEASLEKASKPAKARPVFKRPAPASENAPTPASEEKPESPAETPALAPRPRPVFKRPSATTTTSDQPAKEKASEPKVESPTTDVPKPARPRPVFKRPATEAETKCDETIPQEPFLASNPENSPKTEAGLPIEPVTPVTDAKPATPRPRPVFKRPAAASKEEGGVGEVSAAQEPLSEPQQETSVKTTPSAKPPRPRPVFKRPSASVGPGKEEQESNSFLAQNPENSLKTEEVPQGESTPEETPPPKTPKPRPIFKRPNPPANEGGNPND